MDARDTREAKVTAEDVKELLRRYAEQNIPGWHQGMALFQTGGETERLLILKSDPASSESVPQSHARPAHNP
jgi:hypothetical protein